MSSSDPSKKNQLSVTQDILSHVLSSPTIQSSKSEIEKIEPNAFVVMHSVKDTKGGIIKKRPLH